MKPDDYHPASAFIKMKKKYTHILWDFNGTIFDDVDASRRATNVLLEARGLKQIETVEQLQERFCFPVKKYYSELGFDYSVEPYEDIATEWSKIYDEFSAESGFCNGVDAVIMRLDELGYTQTVLSACESKILTEKLSILGVLSRFKNIFGTDDVNAHSKTQLVDVWRKLNPNAVALVIGDTGHDFEVADIVGADCILYSGGYNSRERLSKFGCPVIDKFEDIWGFIL